MHREIILGTMSFLVSLKILSASDCLVAVSYLLILGFLDLLQSLLINHCDGIM